MFVKNIIANADGVAELLTLLGNGKRLVIIGYLLEGELSVGAIAKKIGLSQSALSQHLARLRNMGLVETRRDRQTIYYSCNSEAVRGLFRALDANFQRASGMAPAQAVNLDR